MTPALSESVQQLDAALTDRMERYAPLRVDATQTTDS